MSINWWTSVIDKYVWNKVYHRFRHFQELSKTDKTKGGCKLATEDYPYFHYAYNNN